MSVVTSAKSGCGCGGGGGVCGCGCGGHGAGKTAYGTTLANCTDQSFHRPRFFPNQLLTHDLLQGLVDYVVGKNRLHNRFLFGDGVVCGLTVTCHPCGGGGIVVAPGYALDCCGNDVLVPCPEELDVKALIRDLRKRQMAGYDCGDPCEKGDDGIESYGLYIVYGEVSKDPVTPWNAGEPCGQQACEPSQICEGYRFELRCECKGPERVDVWDRILACLGDLREATAALGKAQSSQKQALRLMAASRIVAAEEPIPFDARSVTILEGTASELVKIRDFDPGDIDNDGRPRVLPSESRLRLDIARMELLTGAVTRYRMLSSEERKSAAALSGDLDALIQNAQDVLRDAGPRVEALSPHVLSSTEARTEAIEAVRLSRRFAIDDVAPEHLATAQAKFVALSTPVSGQQTVALQNAAAQVKGWLLDKLAGSATMTRCDLYDRVKRVRLDTLPATDAAGVNAASKAVIELVYLLLEYLIDCICLALNPPCRPCEDQAVLLACLKVKECDVVDICNMSRGFVLSPVALRYWLPPIGFIGKAFERLCCEFELKRPKFDRGAVRSASEFATLSADRMPIFASNAFVAPKAADGDTATVLRQFNIDPAELPTVTAFASNLGLLSAAALEDTGGALLEGSKALADLFSSRISIPDASGSVDEKVRSAVEANFAGLRVEARNSLDQLVAASVSDRMDTARDELASVLDQKLASGVTAAVEEQFGTGTPGTIRKLTADNKKLKEEFAKLADAVARLEAGRPT